MIIKTRKDLLNNLIKVAKEDHPYDIPEVLAMPIFDKN